MGNADHLPQTGAKEEQLSKQNSLAGGWVRLQSGPAAPLWAGV